MLTFSRSVHLLPVLWPILICITIITPYIIAVSLDHVYPFLPSISKTANYEPEGSIFGLLMTMVALFGLTFLLARYLQLNVAVQDVLNQDVLRKVTTLNKAALPFGISCLFGVVVVANIRSNLHEVCIVGLHIPVCVSILKPHTRGLIYEYSKAPLSRNKSLIQPEFFSVIHYRIYYKNAPLYRSPNSPFTWTF